MAIYHLSIKIVSRGKGKSAVAAAAYRSGEKITNEYDGLIHDYTRKAGIAHTEILLPEHAPREYADRSVLWNAVERIEKNKNSQLSREIELALPIELSAGQNISLVREYCKQHFVKKGMCADICIHDKNDGNPHAHIMLTMRPIEPDGNWGAKSRKEYILDENGERIVLKSGEYKSRKVDAVDWNNQDNAEIWRAAWADMCNQFLERNNVTEHIDHRSYERQGLDIIPTVHLGVAAFQMEKRGIRTERGDINREIEVSNQSLRELKARIAKLKAWIFEEMQNTEPPTLADVVQEILSRREQTGKTNRYQSTDNLKAAAKILNFLQENQIMDMAGLVEKVKSMHGRQFDIRDKLKPMERRLKVLDENIRHSENYFKHRDIYKIYKQQKPKSQETFYENHRAEITLYEAAEHYLKPVMNGRTTIPTYSWRTERDRLSIERSRLNQEYILLKDEVKEVEKIRWTVYNLLYDESRRKQPHRTRDMGR